MLLLNPIKISYKNLMAAKFRSFLTILGVIIGVGAVILIMAIGQSAQALILDQISGIGSNLIGILPGSSDEKGPPAAVMGIAITTLKYDDLEALRDSRKAPEVEDAAGYVLGTASVSHEGTAMNLSFTGTTASYINVEDAEIERGRFFTEDEETNLSRIAVLGSGSARDLFGDIDPLGRTIKIKDKNFTVVGIFKKRGSTGFGFASQDDSVVIPLRTAQKTILGIDHLGYIRTKIKNENLTESAKENIKIILRNQHNINNPADDDFSVRDQATAINLIKNVTDILRYFLLAIGTIALIVGGVGIMNIMLIAVNQRIREVGLRKALGARDEDLLLQFLVESATISFWGGAIGIILGSSFAFIISLIVQSLGYIWPFLVSFQSISIAALVSISIGILFGIYPAQKAARISPIEALRHE
jgi:putative ABC transport system permease protein